MARAYLNLFNFTKLVYNLQDRYEGPQGADSIQIMYEKENL